MRPGRSDSVWESAIRTVAARRRRWYPPPRGAGRRRCPARGDDPRMNDDGPSGVVCPRSGAEQKNPGTKTGKFDGTGSGARARRARSGRAVADALRATDPIGDRDPRGDELGVADNARHFRPARQAGSDVAGGRSRYAEDGLAPCTRAWRLTATTGSRPVSTALGDVGRRTRRRAPLASDRDGPRPGRRGSRASFK